MTQHAELNTTIDPLIKYAPCQCLKVVILPVNLCVYLELGGWEALQTLHCMRHVSSSKAPSFSLAHSAHMKARFPSLPGFPIPTSALFFKLLKHLSPISFSLVTYTVFKWL